MKSPRISVVVIIVIVGLILPLLLAAGDAEYTTPLIWSNKKQYDPSETAYLYGYGFKPSAQITITIARPDLVEDTVLTSTDEFGYFSCQYLLDGIHGTFNVTATDGVNVATTTFDNALSLSAWWDSHDSIYIYAQAERLSTSKQYYIKYLDPALVERRQSPTYTGVKSFTDKLTILPTFPNVFGWWNVTLYENGALKRTKQVYIDRIVWTTDSTYTTLDTSFAQGEIVYFKTMGLKTTKYYRFKLQMPNGTMFYVSSWTNGVTQMTGSYPLPSNAPLGTWKLHVRQASDASGTCEDHYVDCCFEVTTPPPPQQYYLTVRTEPTGIGTIPEEGWYNACTLINLTALEFFPGPSGTRYRFNYWDVDGVPNATGIYEITVHMNANHTATAHYITQYFLNLTTNPPGVTTPAGVDWYDAGTNAPIFTPEFVGIELGASRYRFINWITGDMSEIADPSATSTIVFMDKAKTVTANYVTQYYLTVISPYGTPGGEGWYNSGDTAYATLDTDFIDHGNGTRRIFTQWSVNGDPWGTNYAKSDPIVMNAPKRAIANWKAQYAVTFTQAGSAVAPTVTYTADVDPTQTVSFTVWVKADTQITYMYQDIVLGAPGVKYVLTDVTPSSPQIVNCPLTISGTYQVQYYLTVNTNLAEVLTLNPAAVSAQGWYNSGSTTTVDAVQNVDKVAGESRYDFRSWTGATPTGVGNQATVLMDGPKTATANYQLQYKITFSQSGVGSEFTGTVVIIDSTNYGRDAVSFWWDSGSSHTFAFQSPLVVTPNVKQHVWTSTTGLSTLQSGSITVSSSGSVTGNYKTQYYLSVFSPSGYGSPNPTSGWFDAGSSITASVTSPWPGSTGTRYVCAGWTGTGSVPPSGTGSSVTFTLTQSSSITWNWVTQYYLTVRTDPSGIATIPGEGWYNSSKSVSLSAPSVSGYTFLNWDVDGASQGSGVSSITVNMNAPHTATAHYAIIPPSLSVSISPLSASIRVGQSTTFASTVSGGTSPYKYQWYLNGNPVSGATSGTWAFTPTASGIYYVYLQVKDANNNTAQSETAKIIVIPPSPVGGYSISLAKRTPTSQIAAYTLLITLFGVALSLRKRKRK
jgi:hypothetical protein